MGGPGQIDVYMNVPEQLTALLYDFDVGSAELKLEHTHWIKANAKRYRTRTMNALVVGLTSRTGSDALNLSLSKRRAANVSSQLYLLDPAHLVAEEKVVRGEEAARIAGLRDGLEDERWRAVFLTLWDTSKLRVPATPKPPVGPDVRRTTRRSFSKFSVEPVTGSPDPGRDSFKEGIDALPALLGGEMAKFGYTWGDEDKKEQRVQLVPADHRVNLVWFHLSYRYKSDWNVMTHTWSATIDYEWGSPPLKTIEVLEDLKIFMNGRLTNSKSSKKMVTRDTVDGSDLLTPPDPK